jgi:hypothetical protein
LEEDALLDTLSILEMNCTLAHDCLKVAQIALERIFPHFFPKATLPDKFELLAKKFTAKADPALAHRQASLKIGVEGTIALVIANGKKLVDWAKVAAVRGLNNEKWTALIKGMKSFSKKIIAILDRDLLSLPALLRWRSSRQSCTPLFVNIFLSLLPIVM